MSLGWCKILHHLALGCAAQVGALHALGPDYQSTFSPLESDAALEQMPAAAALVIDGKEALGPRLIISYNAQVHRSTPLLRQTLGVELWACRDLNHLSCVSRDHSGRNRPRMHGRGSRQQTAQVADWHD